MPDIFGQIGSQLDWMRQGNTDINIPIGSVSNGKVWNNGGWQDQANPNDPNQALNWKLQEGDKLSQRYFDYNSDYNKRNRSFYENLATRSAASEDTLMSLGASSGLGLGGGLYAKQAEILRKRATDEAMTSWYKQSLTNEQLGLQASSQYEQSVANLRNQYLQNEQFNAQRKDSWLSSIIGGVADLGLTALTGGFSSMFDSVFSGGASGPSAGYGIASSGTTNMSGMQNNFMDSSLGNAQGWYAFQTRR